MKELLLVYTGLLLVGATATVLHFLYWAVVLGGAVL